MGCTDSKQQHCCPPGSWPALSVDYVAKGQMEKVEDVDVYHIGQGSKVLILFEDIFGMESSRHKSVADAYAGIGYNVYLPKLMLKPYVGEIDFPKMLACCKSEPASAMKPRLLKLLKHLEGKGHPKVFGAGFCYGIYIAVKLAADLDNFIALAGFHPSFHLEPMIEGGKDTDIVRNCRAPVYFYPCQDDQANCKKGGEMIEIMTKKFGAEKTGTHEFPEQKHGFVVRGDLKLEEVRRDVELAIKLSDHYFQSFK